VRIVLDGRFIQDHFPGIARYTFELARALGGQRGDDEIIVLIDLAAPNRRYDLARLNGLAGVSVRPIVAPVFSPLGLVRLTLALRSLRPDVYHSPYFLRTPFGPSPSVVSIFDLIAEQSDPLPDGALASRVRSRIFYHAIAVALRTSTRVIVPSEATASDLTALHPVDRRKVDVIQLGVDPIFRPVEPKLTASLRDRYRLPDSFVLCVTINKPHKNLATLIRAVGLASASGLVLVVAGAVDRRYPSALDLAQASGVERRVIVLGVVPEADLPALYSAADVLVCPSLAEGFGLTALEAMACGTPVVSSNRSSLPEVVADAGIQVDPLDEGEIADAIGRVVGDSALAARLKAAGLHRAAQLTWGRTAIMTLEAYRAARHS